MPIDPIALLALARELATRSSGQPSEAECRRSISTAYYAVFHMLIQAATKRLICEAGFADKVARVFQHGPMKFVCDLYSPDKPNPKTGEFQTPSKLVVSAEIRQVAEAFYELQEARETADYDGSATVNETDAMESVEKAELAFRSWQLGEMNPSAGSLLQELFLKSVSRR